MYYIYFFANLTLFLIYLAEAVTDIFTAFNKECRDVAINEINKQGLETYLKHTMIRDGIRHFIYVSFLGMILYVLIFKTN